ncbi:MAG: PadR family transcriptional regulator [Euryarchaeota archaeon]|nr:PadR family transcriptional regulator [Euryarchaeota archaeon]
MLAENRRKGMRLIILDTLKDEELHGYAISEKITEEYGIKKPSPGIIYPTLASLRKAGLIEVCSSGPRDRKTYRITPAGRKYLEKKAEELNKAKTTLRNLGEFHKLGGHELMHVLTETIKEMNSIDERKREELGRILRETTRKIEAILEGEK